ncbi:MAG TPA: hypothetical protein VHZ51_01790 [Ktedonobacteraceae bacterium]|nr:hypothetical protein [Ktedonobacteraceae bacterium]
MSEKYPITMLLIVDLSKFNEPVTITSPASAIPTDNPLVNFGGQ